MASVDHRSAAEIEREIEAERSALSRTLDEIHDRLSFESLSNDLFGRVRESSSDIGKTVARGVRDNPVPLALTAVGLVWLAVNQRGSSRSGDPYARAAATPASGRYGGTTDLRDPDAVQDPASLYDAAGRPLPQRVDSRWDRARGAARDARHSAADTVRSGRDHAAAGASDAANSARSGLSSASNAVRRRAHDAYASASDLRHRITEGTEHMSESARKRVLAARTRAYEAQLRAEHYASRGRERATDFFDDQPLVVGALALAVGAAIGGLLPRTSREDDTFGSYRDQVFDEAERVYHEESAKLEAVARETVSEARNVAREVGEDVRGDLKEGVHRTGDIARTKFAEAEGKAKDAAGQVADTAKTEADKQKLGQG